MMLRRRFTRHLVPFVLAAALVVGQFIPQSVDAANAPAPSVGIPHKVVLDTANCITSTIPPLPGDLAIAADGPDCPIRYTLTIRYAGNGSGSVTTTPLGPTFVAGTVVTLTAVPSATSTFAGWSGAVTGMTNPITLTMNCNKTVTATFDLKAYTLTLNYAGAGAGTVSKSPDSPTYTPGTVVTLTATPDPSTDSI
jgi:hypothetical protein